MKIYMACPIT